MEKNALEFKLNLLRDEINTVHIRIAGFDELSFNVKGWAATLWAGLVGYSVSQNNPLGVAVSIPILLLFWILDAFFKSYQHRVRARMTVIEQFLDRTSEEKGESLAGVFNKQSIEGFIIYDIMCNRTFQHSDAEFRNYFKRKTSLFRAFRTGNVFLLYGGLIASSIILILYLGLKPA
jgi:hypothetical protein